MKELLQSSVNVLPQRVRYWIKHIPGLAASQRWLLRRYLEGQPFVHTLNAGPAAGLKFEITLPRDKAIWTGTYEHEFTRAIVEHIRLGDICYDIGGYRGYMSGAMALAGASRVFVFEPLATNQQALQRLCDLNPALPISVLHIAVSEGDGLQYLKVMPDSSMAKLADSSFQVQAICTGVTPVTARHIDSLVHNQQILPPQLVKIDVEGAELDVLKGAIKTLRDSRPKIFLEAHAAVLEKACSELLLQFGYKIHRIERESISEDSVRHLICLP